jgi:hypothetical protein
VFYRVLFYYFERFFKEYEYRFEKEYGYFRPVIQDVVERYLDCGNPMCGITQDMYDKKYKEYRSKQGEIKKRIDNLDKADHEYFITASYILSLANRAYDLFMSSEPMIKRQLLNFHFRTAK